MQRKQKKTISTLSIPPRKSRYEILFILLLIQLLFSLPRPSFSQDTNSEKKAKVLFNDHDDKGLKLSTFYVELAPKTAFSSIGDKVSGFVLLEGGIIINRSFSIGYFVATSPKTTLITVPLPGTPEYQQWVDSGVRLQNLPSGQTQAYLYYSNHGLNLGYMFRPHKIVYPRTTLKVGRGVLEMTGEQKHLFQFFKNSIFKEKVWSLKPELGIGLNVRPWWRFYIDVGYQFLLEGDTEIIDSGNLDGMSVEFGFGFGAFSR